MTEPEKIHYSYQQIHRTIAALAESIKATGFEPDLIVAIGAGGFIPARILRSYLRKPILSVGVSLYDELNQPIAHPRKIQWLDEAERKLTDKRILLVDEVDDSRVTLAFCLRELLSHQPAEIGVAVLHCKEKEKRDVLPPAVKRYWAGERIPDKWVVYPWDALDIDQHQARSEAARPAAFGSVESTSELLLNFGGDGRTLLPVVTQDAQSGAVLILSWVNREAFDETRKTGLATYWSRSRNCLWRKGESSGDRLRVQEIRVNCEQNSLLYLVEPLGQGACHATKPEGGHYESCYYRRIDGAGLLEPAAPGPAGT